MSSIRRVSQTLFNCVDDDGKSFGTITKVDVGWRVSFSVLDFSYTRTFLSFDQLVQYVKYQAYPQIELNKMPPSDVSETP